MNDRAARTPSVPEERELWPATYEAPSIEPLGTIWNRTGDVLGAEIDTLGTGSL